jgi:hypothetical protein
MYKDNNPFNIRKKNLIIVTKSVYELKNKQYRKDNKYGIPGLSRVYWGNKSYRLNIQLGGEYKTYGYFNDIESAAIKREHVIDEYIKENSEAIKLEYNLKSLDTEIDLTGFSSNESKKILEKYFSEREKK